jgi:RNA polymerase sigma factor (sigma-70 family)
MNGTQARAAARARGDIPPFHTFLERHRADVYRFLVASVGPQEADDCFQETFLSALRAYPGLADAQNLRGWVFAIAARKAVDAARARGRRAVPVAEVPDRPAPAGSDGEPPPVPDDPLWEAVRGLPPRQRVAVVHRVLLDRPYPELAEAMGCSVQTARANVYQGLKRLRGEVRAGR